MKIFHQVLVAYRLFRLRTHRRLVRSMHAKYMRQRAKDRAFLAMRVDQPPRFDERSTIDRFRRESGIR